MSDGFALIEVNLEGKGRVKESNFFDLRLSCADFDNEFLCDELMSQIAGEPKDQLILATFTYKSIENHYMEGTEYEDSFILDTSTMVVQNYKEFYRHQLTLEFKLPEWGGFDEERKKMISHWEEFYDEDFKPWVKPVPLRPDGVVDL